MKEGKGSIQVHAGEKWYVYIPYVVSRDSAFPFKKGDKVKVTVLNGKLLVEKTRG